MLQIPASTSFEVACLRKAVLMSSLSMPQPSSVTLMSSVPPALYLKAYLPGTAVHGVVKELPDHALRPVYDLSGRYLVYGFLAQQSDQVCPPSSFLFSSSTSKSASMGVSFEVSTVLRLSMASFWSLYSPPCSGLPLCLWCPQSSHLHPWSWSAFWSPWLYLPG